MDMKAMLMRLKAEKKAKETQESNPQSSHAVRFETHDSSPRAFQSTGSGDAYPMDQNLNNNLGMGVRVSTHGKETVGSMISTMGKTPVSVVDYGRPPQSYTSSRYSSGGTMGSGNFTVFGNAGLDMAEASVVQQGIGNNDPSTRIESSQQHKQITDAFANAIAGKSRIISEAHARDPSQEHSARIVLRKRGG